MVAGDQRCVPGKINSALNEMAQGGQSMGGSRDQKSGGRGWARQKLVKFLADVFHGAIVMRDNRFDAGTSFAKSRFAFQIASSCGTRIQEHEAFVSAGNKTADGVAARGAIIHVHGREQNMLVARSGDDGGQFLFQEPFLHRAGGKIKEPDGSAHPAGEFAQCTGG
jgi:hypothetical protein